MKLVIVDDDKLIRKILFAMVQELNYDVVLAETGEEAWDIIQKIHEPAIILMDWVMPGINGVELCRKIKARQTVSYTYVIMLTSKSKIEDLVAGFDAGADDFLVKPVDSRELSSRLAVGSRILNYQYTLEQKNVELQATKRVMENIMRELRGANEKLRSLSLLDGLTGVSNRRSLEEYLEQEWSYAAQQGMPITFIMLDVDFFKLYNDTYGHQAGDECLRKIARVLSEKVGNSSNLAARYGGEEFTVVLKNSSMDYGIAMAESIRQAVECLSIPHSASKIADHVTVSLGVATLLPQPNQAYGDLIKLADEALYKAKNNGRNQYSINTL